MLPILRKKLEHAEGRSEFVISVACDIRGFSHFSTCHESPDTAMFIKRFYLNLLNKYFTGAAFAKPTGDGMLLVFRYSEQDLHQVSDTVLTTCLKVVDEFPTMFKDDPMINFSTPSCVGFGISRGPSCCLFSGRMILDYSGQLLNLASRLNDLARPKGIVIAGSYLQDVIPPALRSRFKLGQVYIRGIAEDNPIDVFFSQADVVLPAYALQPITAYNWQLVTRAMTVAELRKLSGEFIIDIPVEPVARDKTLLQAQVDHPTMPKYFRRMRLEEYEIYKDAYGHHVRFGLATAQGFVKQEGVRGNKSVEFRFQFVPKPEVKTTKRRKKA